MSVRERQFVVVTGEDQVVAETLSTSRSYSLRRYKAKWLGSYDNPSQEWTRRRRRGFRVASVDLIERSA